MNAATEAAAFPGSDLVGRWLEVQLDSQLNLALAVDKVRIGVIHRSEPESIHTCTLRRLVNQRVCGGGGSSRCVDRIGRRAHTGYVLVIKHVEHLAQ